MACVPHSARLWPDNFKNSRKVVFAAFIHAPFLCDLSFLNTTITYVLDRRPPWQFYETAKKTRKLAATPDPQKPHNPLNPHGDELFGE